MCLIIVANDLKSLNYKDLETAYKRNSDGFGVMYLDNKKNFVSDKFCPKNFNELKKFFNYHKKKTDQMAIHFRFKTEGAINKKNCHPFISYQKNNRTIGLMHNGARLPIPIIHNGSSDTWHFNQHYLKSVLQDNPNIILNKDYQDELSEFIDKDKLVLLDSQSNKFIIINEKLGNFKGANWFSNTYWQDQPITTFKSQNDNKINYYGGHLNSWDDYQYDWFNDLDISDVLELNNNEIYDYIESCMHHERVDVIADIIFKYKNLMKQSA